MIGTTHFYRGEVKPENELLGILYAVEIDDPGAVRISHEHDEARWMTWPEVDEFLPEGHWLKWVIGREQRLRAGLTADLQSLFLEQGFETNAIKVS